jgi:plastocyanin
VGGCASHDTGVSGLPPKEIVLIQGDAYNPATVRIPVGGVVTWFSMSERPATVETDGVPFFEVDRDKLDRQGKFDLHTFRIGEADSKAFDTPGRYEYHSSLDEQMRGAVVVVPRARSSTPAGG